MTDVFTSRRVLIRPDVRSMQIEFHVLQAKRVALRKAVAKPRAEYKALRRQGFAFHPDFDRLADIIRPITEQLVALDRQRGWSSQPLLRPTPGWTGRGDAK